MKLGYVCQYFTREYRGPVTNLMYELSKNISVVNYSFLGKHMQYYGTGVHSEDLVNVNESLMLRRYNVKLKISGLLFPKNLESLLLEDRPDILQCEEYYQPASNDAFRYSKKNKIPFIFNHRGSEPRTRTLRERIYFMLANPLSRRLVEGSDAIVCLSQSGKKTLCGIFPQVEEKIHIIPNSIDPAAYSKANGSLFRQQHNIPDKSPLILCVARIHPQKRIDLLVKTFAKIKEQVPDSILCVVGPWFDAEKRKIDSLVAKLGVDAIIFTGPIPNDEVKNAYAAADVVALTSEFEPFGYCLLEAMCQSKPVVAFSIGAIPEIIEDNVTGYYVPFADITALAGKITALLVDGDLSYKMGSHGLSRVNKNFHIKENSGKLIKLYTTLVGE